MVGTAQMSRNLRIVLTVLLLHGAALWALQSGLLRRTVAMLVPPQVIMAMMESAEPSPPAPPQPSQAPAPASTRSARISPAPPTLMTVATALAQPSEIAPAAVAPSAAPTSTDRASATPSVASATGTSAPAAPRVEPPSSDADYLNNPKPPYPPLSRRLGEQGKVVIRTLIGADGMAQEASIHQSSGFDRLDQAALATARKWRYVPGKRAGVAEAMWFNVPFTFLLE